MVQAGPVAQAELVALVERAALAEQEAPHTAVMARRLSPMP